MISNLYLILEQSQSEKRCSSLILWWLFFKNKTIIIVIEVVWDFESLTVISVEYFCKVNPAWFTCLTVENIS